MERLTDKQLHEQAHKRVEFRTHLLVYLIINGMLWLVWYLTGSLTRGLYGQWRGGAQD